MKITKRQLRRIIAEESARLNESNVVRIMDDSGPITVSANFNRDGTNTSTIRFGKSYTLRLDEQGLDTLRNLIHDALLEAIAEK